ncbi:inositol monophosphatase [bacterium]|nr:inositol monophosphatase [bacterium]MCB9479723.1 inositol monophosphatase [Deltaproteobacteria bacterium]
MSERLDAVVDAAREGGRLALSLRGDLDRQIKDDGSIVTNADLAVQELVVERLSKLFPDVGMIGEEEGLRDLDGKDAIFAIDPIDGTDCYQRGYPHFGVSIGLIEGDTCTLGVFYNPVLEMMYAVDTGERPTLNGRAFSIAEEQANHKTQEGPLLLAPSNFHRHFITDFRGKIRSLGSMAHHLCYVASGYATATLAMNTHIWDVVAGVALIQAAGGAFKTLSGEPFDPRAYLHGGWLDEPFLGAVESRWDDVCRQITPKQNPSTI